MRLIRFIFSRLFICITVIAALTAAIIFLCVYIHSLLPAAAAIALAYALTLTAALYLMHGDSPADYKCGWLILITVLPVGGAVLYFLSCMSRSEKKSAAAPLPRAKCSGYEFFGDGKDYLEKLTEAIASAKKRVYLEYYIISKGHIWGSVFGELKRALARNVDVKIIYDGLGSALKAPKKDLKELVRLGAGVKVFNKLMPLPSARLNFRDHRKIAAIDGKAVFVGGVNVADEYANLNPPYGFWKDGGALFYGQIASVYEKIFLCDFGGKDYKADYAEADSGVTPVCDEPEKKGSVCEDILAGMIYSAQKRIYIATPYLCMGDKLYDALFSALKRKVAVRILIPGIPDKKLTYAITRTYARKLSAAGAEIYVFTPGFMHFKCVICDDKALTGSYNFDYRSMRLNYENGVLAQGELADELAVDFENSLALSTLATHKKRCAPLRLVDFFLRLFAPLV